jgi:hypothetical protein
MKVESMVVFLGFSCLNADLFLFFVHQVILG